MQSHGHIGRQGPRRRGPDNDGGLRPGQFRIDIAEITVDSEFHVDRRRGVLMILDLGFGQRGHTGGAPVDRLLASDHRPGEEKFIEFPGDGGLVIVTHGQVRPVPVTEHPEALELFFLDLDPLFRVTPAGASLGQGGDGCFLVAQFLVDVMLDRQAVTVPAGNVRRIETGHPLGTQDDVLENLVESGTEMDIAVGVGGAVVQDEQRPSGTSLLNPLIKVFRIPALQYQRFILGQVGLHLE